LGVSVDLEQLKSVTEHNEQDELELEELEAHLDFLGIIYNDKIYFF
jgi:hypothetical protein